MRRPRARLVLGLGIPLLIVVVLLAAWAIDSSSASGKVPRNVTLGGRDISKLPEDELANTVADVADHYADVEVQVRTPERTYKVKAGTLGLKLDQKATVQKALDLDEDTSLPGRPFVWASSFLEERSAPLAFTVDDAALEKGLAGLGGNATASEPSLVPGANAITILSGSSGTVIQTEGVADQILAKAKDGDEPIIVNAKVTAKEPDVSDADAQAIADKLTAGTAKGLAIDASGKQTLIPAATVRSWLGSKVERGKLVVTLDAEKAKAALTDAIPGDSRTVDATVKLVNGAIVISPSKDGATCCAADTAARLLAAINAGSPTVGIDLEVSKAKFTTEMAQKLGIKEPVGTTTTWNGQPQVKSFTTYYDPGGGGRVTNIHRIADLVNGTVVKPGETFSINGTVGQRTTAKGFVEAGAIANGEHVDEIGGGVSQFATTMFNAAYFAGLDITAYQAHSEHFARYPRGREATMGFPNPDMAWKNDTPYGILIESTWGNGTVTVRLWSTQYAYGEQTGSSDSRSGNCTVVTTTRTIHKGDGSTATDQFRARYRDEGKTTC
ncbi:VanW family protein [Aquihabitans sp. G128]|uniref:VanW family protein n=1 Tax=Aquihabitans sp. G128 TaxID=2849779 RepID=UPI001C24E5ED|nr:VanW family protein [Aquihabitans sp. G128]QXC61505.1 VanW family protein [Aquihabitans sp. G128]